MTKHNVCKSTSPPHQNDLASFIYHFYPIIFQRCYPKAGLFSIALLLFVIHKSVYAKVQTPFLHWNHQCIIWQVMIQPRTRFLLLYVPIYIFSYTSICPMLNWFLDGTELRNILIFLPMFSWCIISCIWVTARPSWKAISVMTCVSYQTNKLTDQILSLQWNNYQKSFAWRRE